jgi:tryptophanyl-tRNA synthetase
MRSKILDAIMAHGEQQSLELYNEYANGRITINECIAGSNRIQEETLKKYREEVARILTLE